MAGTNPDYPHSGICIIYYSMIFWEDSTFEEKYCPSSENTLPLYVS